jgi:GT2 family glycosyltransferase
VLRLSIIIPVLGPPTLLDDTLVSVLESRPANCEIIVIHTAPYDDPYDLAGEVRFLKAKRKAGLAECLNLGLAASQAAVVHVLACDVEVSAGWADAAIGLFSDPQVAAVAPVVLHRGDRQTVVSAGLGYRAEGTVWRLGQGLAATEIGKDANEFRGPDALAAFYRRSALDAIGGFSPWTTATRAGIDVALALWHAGFRCVAEPRCIVRADDGAVREKSGFGSGRAAERLFWRWAAMHGRFRSALAHAALVAGECTIGLWRPLLVLRLFGRAWGGVRATFGSRACGAGVSPPQAVETAASQDDGPSVISTPQFAAKHRNDERRAVRAA